MGRPATTALLGFLVVSALVALALGDSNRNTAWAPVTSVLEDERNRHTYPGCVAAVVGEKGLLYHSEIGNFTYGSPPPLNQNSPPTTNTFLFLLMNKTLFDLASLTKVLSTTTAVMQFYQRGQLDLEMPIASPALLGPDFAANGKGTITMRNLLLHDAGFPPDPSPNYWQPGFGCPETKNYHPAENFSCQKRIYRGLMEQTLRHEVGEKYVYSDLSMITAMYVVGRLAKQYHLVTPRDLLSACAHNLQTTDPEIYQCYYEAYVRKYVFEASGMSSSGFLPSQSNWSNTAPTWDDQSYLHRVIQGQVSDGNAYALGGIAGHAGLFSTIIDVTKLVRRFMWAPQASTFVNSTTWEYFSTVKNLTQSSRAFGWNTNNYKMNDYRGCSDLSELTWTHTGYTGTQVCGDPERGIVTILLTNRCYPYQTKTLPDIHRARQRFNSAVATVYDSIFKQK